MLPLLLAAPALAGLHGIPHALPGWDQPRDDGVRFLAPDVLVQPPGRPDEGSGLYHFDASDEVVYLDGPDGIVRVHYSVSGPNQTLLDDDDGDGLPDFPEMVAEVAEQVLEFYAGLGFRMPVAESEMGLDGEGGSDAFDFYLVDFGGGADGAFSAEACTSHPDHCAGYMLVENDFRGYGYPDIESAVRTLTSHELFHAVQSAYESDSPIWYAEGTAVWGQWQFDPGNEDFLAFAAEYFTDTGRSLDEPPTGPVPTFAYATCIWWEFLTLRLGTDYNVALEESLEWTEELSEPPDTLEQMEALIEAHGSTLREEWSTFAAWNLLSGDHAGELESYPFAAELGREVEAEVEGPDIHDDNRFYPLAATYYRIDHPGGPLVFANADDATGLHFALYSVADGAPDGPIDALVAEWDPAEPAWTELGELPAGGYWLLGTYPENAPSSQKVEFCLGDEALAADCVPASAPDTGDTGAEGKDEPGGCACSSTSRAPAAAWLLGLLLPALALRRRR